MSVAYTKDFIDH